AALRVVRRTQPSRRCSTLFPYTTLSRSEAFVNGSGINEWADRYRLVVLYPQTRASLAPLNPKACWDWWGYTGANYDTRAGAQLKWLNSAASVLGAPLQ